MSATQSETIQCHGEYTALAADDFLERMYGERRNGDTTFCFCSSMQQSESYRHTSPIESLITLRNCITSRFHVFKTSCLVKTIKFFIMLQVTPATGLAFQNAYLTSPLSTFFAAKQKHYFILVQMSRPHACL